MSIPEPGSVVTRARHGALHLWRPGRNHLAFFASVRGEPRERSVSDAVVLGASALVVAVLALVTVPPSGFEAALVGVVDAVPSFVDVLWRLGVLGLVGWSVTLALTALVRRRGDVAVDMGASLVVAAAAGLLLWNRLNGGLPTVSEAVTGASGGTVPLVSLTVVVALDRAASPYLSRPARRLGRLLTAGGALSVAMLGASTPAGAVLSLALGTMVAAGVHVALGCSTGRPDTAAVAAALEAAGLDLDDIRADAEQESGVVLLGGRSAGDGPVRLKVYGRDARDTQLLQRTWRALWFRGRVPVAASRRQQVEHEAFVTLFASSRGVPAPRVLSAGRTGSRDELLVLADVGAPLAERPGGGFDDDVVDSMWDALSTLHSAGFAHGALSSAAIHQRDGRAMFADLGPARSVDSDDQVRTDCAQMLVVTACLLGAERAARLAAARLGADGVVRVLPYLQPPALGSILRKEVASASLDLEELRTTVAAEVDVEVPELVRLRRVSPQTLVTIALLAFVAFTLVAGLSGVDLAEVWAEIRTASPWWALSALLVAQGPFLGGAVATRGASPKPLPFGPVVMLEVAIAFVAVAVPSTAGRLALGIRFFQRQGVPPTAAVSISAIDSFSGFVVQVLLLVLTLVVGIGQVDLTVTRPQDGGLGNLVTLLVVAAVSAVVLAVLALALRRVRRRVVERLRPLVAEVRQTVGSLRSPAKVVQLFGGNIANQFVFALALGACLQAFGEDLNLATLLVIYIAAALFGGLMPVPGGIGVVEAALMTGLIAAGISSATASATALLFRAVTFYVPPLWGWIALRWLQRNSYL